MRYIFVAVVRQAGKDAHEKLLVFYYALYASGLFELAELAKTALDAMGIEF
jgi:hypothetical protein